jgi:predicted NBD/HSP70 family sugar kinase
VAGLGLEINVDYLAVKALDLAGQVLDERVQWTDLAGSDPTQAVLDLANLARPVRRRLTAQKVRLAGATLAVAGPVDRATGRLRSAPNLGWQDLDLLGLVRRRLRLPELKVGNEATLAARAELASLGDHQASFVYVSGGVGIGAGIVQHGALYSGSHGWAGELGHVTVDAAGPPCACGSNGCLEQYAGRSAILTAAGLATLPAAPRATAAGGTGDAGAGGLEGDPTAQALHAAMSQAGRALGIALSGAINLMDLNTVVLGGDFAHLIRLLLPALRQELELRVVSWGWAPDDQFVRPAAGPALPAVAGAALAAIDRVAANPAAYLAQ